MIDEIYYTTKDLIEETSLTKSTLYYRIEKLKIPYRQRKIKGFIRERVFTLADFNKIVNYIPKKDLEIIYVTRTYEIIHSKLNFLELEQL